MTASRLSAIPSKSGKQVAVLFDIHKTQAPFESIDGYVMSPDGKQLLVITKSKAVYRRSFKAEYFIYNIASKKLRKLSGRRKPAGGYMVA